MEKWSRLVKKLARLLYSGKLQEGDVYEPMISNQGKYFFDAVDKSFGEQLNQKGLGYKDPELMQQLKENVFVFSGFKNYQQLKETSALLKDAQGNIRSFRDFLSDVRKVDSTYNQHYLQAEYNHAVNASQMISKWKTFEEESDALPFLRYDAVNDNRTRPEHASLDGVTRKINDVFWKKYFPPNGWNCRCDVVQEVGGETPTKNIQYPEVAPMFRNNVGIDGIIFPKSHPYYDAQNKEKAAVIEKIAIKMANTNVAKNRVIKGKKGGELSINPNHTAKEVKENIMYSMPLINNGYKVELPAHIEKDGVKKIDATVNGETADFKELGKKNEVKNFNNSIEKLLQSASDQKVHTSVLFINKPLDDLKKIKEALIWSLSNKERKKSIKSVLIVLNNKKVIKIIREDIINKTIPI